MSELSVIKEALGIHFQNLTEIEDNVIRGEQIYQDKCYAVAFFDLSDNVISRAQDLRSFQERVIGAEYFNSPDQLRWNSYLYLLAGQNSIGNEGFEKAKVAIESNKDYTRKLVLSSEDMLLMLKDSPLFTPEYNMKATDVTASWVNLLNIHQLNTLIDKPSRKRAIKLIEEGQGSRELTRLTSTKLSSKDTKLTNGFLKSLNIESFRPVHDGKNYNFTNVNLIVGPNGSGKTSLLEAIEYLYCGRNRRAGGITYHRLSGLIQQENSDMLESVIPTLEISRLKTRNYVWYRKEEYQAKSILDGFTKYNFLDTDAAFRLSTELQPVALRDDLQKFLVGSDASTLWDYLGKVMDDLADRTKDLNHSITIEKIQNEDLDKKLRQAALAPSQSSSLSKTYRAALRELGWKGKEANLDSAVSEQERPKFEAVLNSLKRIRTIMSTNLPISKDSLNDQLHNIGHIRDSAKTSESERIQIADDIIKRTNELAQAEKTSTLLAEWSTYCVADAPKLIRAIHNGRDDVKKIQTQLGSMASTLAPSLPNEYAKIVLDDVDILIAKDVKNAHQEVQTTEIAQRNIESLQQSLSLFRRQLQEAARQILLKTEQDELCPVCDTRHPPEILHMKIEALSGKEILPEVSELATRIQAAKNRENKLVQVQLDILTLRNMAISLDLDPSIVSSNEIRDRLLNQQRRLSESVESLQRAEAAFENFDLIGLSPARYMELRPIIESLFESNGDIESPSVIDSAKQNLSSEVNTLNLLLGQLNRDMIKVSIELQELLRRAPISSQTFINLETDIIFKTIEEELQQTQLANMMLEKIGHSIELPDNQSISDLEISITSVTEAFDRALYSLQNEIATNQALVELQQNYDASNVDIKNKREKLRHIKNAHTALKNLRSEHSLSNATDNVFNTIRDQINDVFSRIHSPKEYEFSSSSDSLIVTRNGEPRKLEQVSTGQRAAFALSIFLSLNSTARSAPPIVLIDDPIAHIDDLNALSFLDYLRDMVLHSRRQIFFATADTRIAALFDKKFSFLGEGRYKKLQLSARA